MRKLPLLEHNIIWTLDSYKQLHDPMYPEETVMVASYAEARSGSEYPYTVVFGLQYNLIRWLEGEVVTTQMIDEAEPFMQEHFKFCGKGLWKREKWDYIVKQHKGRLPLIIKAVPEGMVVPKGNILFEIRNTDPACFWLTNALETVLQQTWYGTAVATRSNYIVSYIKKAFKKTVDENTQWLADFMLHDFGQRGVTCMEQAGVGGMAHLVNSKGTDSDMAIPYAVNFYGAKKEGLCYSVPASEHSIATALGPDKQYQVTQRLCKLFPDGILSVVSDSYGIEDAVKEYCHGETKQFILARNGKFVVRPDSKRFDSDKPCNQVLWIVEQLAKGFGFTINDKGYKVLGDKVGVIYGDGLSVHEIFDCVDLLMAKGYSAQNCVYGQGGGLLQKLSRDTIDFAIKCCAQTRGNVTYDIFKKPQGGTKVSKVGLQKLVWQDGAHLKVPITVPVSDPRPDIMEVVFKNGTIMKEYTFDEVRANALRNLYNL